MPQLIMNNIGKDPPLNTPEKSLWNHHHHVLHKRFLYLSHACKLNFIGIETKLYSSFSIQKTQVEHANSLDKGNKIPSI